VAALLEEFEDQASRMLITEATTDSRPIPSPAQQLADITLRLRNQFIDRQMNELIQQANQPETSEEESINLLRKQQQLRNLKRSPIAAPA
jgi:hypothetical protein